MVALMGRYYIILNTFEILGSLGTTGNGSKDHIFSTALWFCIIGISALLELEIVQHSCVDRGNSVKLKLVDVPEHCTSCIRVKNLWYDYYHDRLTGTH